MFGGIIGLAPPAARAQPVVGATAIDIGQNQAVTRLGWTPQAYGESSGPRFPADIARRIVITSGNALTDNPGYAMRSNPDFNVYFPLGGGAGRLFTSHEIADSDPSEAFPTTTLQNRSGGITRLTLDAANTVVASGMHEWQTSINCSGGVTGWGTFLTCEEFPTGTGSPPEDGYVWEIDPNVVDGKFRIDAMGRFSHEAVEHDLAGNFYLTEDNTPGYIYRFVPAAPGSVRQGGALYALDAVNREWVAIINPYDAPHEAALGGATPFQRPEGISRDPLNPNRMAIALTGSSTTFPNPWGSYLKGAVLSLDIATLELEELAVWSAQDDRTGVLAQLQRPDNLRYDERGVLFICEDHTNSNFARDINGNPLNDGRNEIVAYDRATGNLYRFAIMSSGAGEWTGPFFAETGAGKTLFVNAMGPNRVYALTGFRPVP